MIPGIGTAVNVATVLLGATVGVLLGNRLPVRTRDVVTDALGLVTLLIAGTSAMAVLDADLSDAVGDERPDADRARRRCCSAGSSARCCASSSGWSGFGGWLQTPARRRPPARSERHRFIEGFVVASLVFCTGPLTILGSLNDGLGNGADQLFLKAVLDGFAAIAFAASFGWGVAASALTVVVVQGSLTVRRAPARRRAARRAPRRPRPRPAACCWSASPCACCGSGRSRSPTCSPRWSSRRFSCSSRRAIH